MAAKKKKASKKSPRRAGAARSAAPKKRAPAKAKKVARAKKPARVAKAVAKPIAKGKTRGKTKSASPKTPAAAKRKATAKKARKVASPPAPPPVRRRDRAGHLDPTYAKELRSRSDRPPRDPDGFLTRPRASDTLVEELGEEYVTTLNSGEYEGGDVRAQETTEEIGGPFVESTGGQEFADGTDLSNPKGATREPFPTT